MPPALDTLRAEHRATARLLDAAQRLVAQAHARGEPPDFTLLRTMLFWLAEFPERRHHRRESVALFPRVRARAPLARHVLDHLEEDHLRGEARIRELAHALTAFELLGASRRAAFETMLARYFEFQATHMRLEEQEIFPLARRVLTAADWQEVDAECVESDLSADAEAAGLLARLRPHLEAMDSGD